MPSEEPHPHPLHQAVHHLLDMRPAQSHRRSVALVLSGAPKAAGAAALQARSTDASGEAMGEEKWIYFETAREEFDLTTGFETIHLYDMTMVADLMLETEDSHWRIDAGDTGSGVVSDCVLQLAAFEDRHWDVHSENV